MFKKKLDKYNKYGFLLYELFSKKEHELIHKFAINWFYKLCKINQDMLK